MNEMQQYIIDEEDIVLWETTWQCRRSDSDGFPVVQIANLQENALYHVAACEHEAVLLAYLDDV